MDRNPTHGDASFFPRLPGGKNDLENSCGNLRIFHKHLIKIAQPEKEDCLLMLCFYPPVLP